jgi:NapC/NirT cytochrome c family, N-terminal region
MNSEEGRTLHVLAFLFRNGLTKAGAVITTSSAFSLILFWILDSTSKHGVNPYLGILIYMVLPGIFVTGLLLIPLGIGWHRWKVKALDPEASIEPVDVHSKGFRRGLMLVAGLTVMNFVMVGFATYRGVEYMDSNAFCGLTCHLVMAPEYVAYQGSPHVRVGCVGCHIGAGAGWFVKSKLSGAHQVIAVNLKTYPRPIPVPVANLRPARETCEQCHWPEKFAGDKIIVRTHFDDDEANTPKRTVLVMHIGGLANGHATGIHGRHLDRAMPISYASTDSARQSIPSVKLGNGTEFLGSGASGKEQASQRVMDCIDCHNRPSHRMQTPESAMDQLLQSGAVNSQIPFIRRQGVAALKSAKSDETPARIGQELEAFYRDNQAEFYRTRKTLLDGAIAQIQAAWSRNVFPHMKVTWGTYTDNIGHDQAPGCFRCHDGSHQSKDGRTIASECDTCHTILAQDEADPKILKTLNIQP